MFILRLLIDPRIKDFSKNNIPPKVVGQYTKEDSAGALDDLRKEFSQNKEYPKQFELAILSALSHYPELKEAKITFALVNSSIPLTSRPDVLPLLNPFGPRSYTIRISKDLGDRENDFLFKNHSFNKQVGVIGHELAHVVMYEEALPYKVAGFGIGYAFSSFRAKFERATDVATIEHGLGHQLYDWNSGFYDVAPTYITDSYLSPDEIKNMMKGLDYYD